MRPCQRVVGDFYWRGRRSWRAAGLIALQCEPEGSCSAGQWAGGWWQLPLAVGEDGGRLLLLDGSRWWWRWRRVRRIERVVVVVVVVVVGVVGMVGRGGVKEETRVVDEAYGAALSRGRGGRVAEESSRQKGIQSSQQWVWRMVEDCDRLGCPRPVWIVKGILGPQMTRRLKRSGQRQRRREALGWHATRHSLAGHRTKTDNADNADGGDGVRHSRQRPTGNNTKLLRRPALQLWGGGGSSSSSSRPYGA